jgi:murein DD-endopeptidase MepM/ murein hydrolase activator NlpD
MLFNSLETWWGGRGVRDRPHEGLDFFSYADGTGQLANLDETTVVPVMYDGEVARIDDDFLGKSVYVLHGMRDLEGNELYTIYGHTEPDHRVRRGRALARGERFATIADTSLRRAQVAPHLHVSVAWMPESLGYEDLHWKTIVESRAVRLLNPLEVIPSDYVVLRQD